MKLSAILLLFLLLFTHCSKDDNDSFQENSTLKLTIEYENNTWTVEGDLVDINSDNIIGAVIKVSNQELKYDNDNSTYSAKINNLDPDQEVTITVESSNISLKTYKLAVPPALTKAPIFDESKNKELIAIKWEGVNCSEYKVHYEAIDNSQSGQTQSVEQSIMDYVNPLVTTSYSISGKVLLNLNPSAGMFSFWVCPVNTLKNLQGLGADSRIMIIGKGSDKLSGKFIKS